MKTIKPYLLAAVALFCAVGCSESTFKQNYPLYATFDYTPKTEMMALFKDTTYFAGTAGLIRYDVLTFNNALDGSDSTRFGGFALGYKSDTLVVDDPYVAYDRDTLKYGDQFFMLFRQNELTPQKAIEFVYADKPACSCTILGCYIANTAHSFDVLQNFGPGDHADVVFTGYKSGAKTGEKSFSLLDKDGPLSKRTLVDLSALGSVDYITINLSSTDNLVDTFVLYMIAAQVVIEL